MRNLSIFLIINVEGNFQSNLNMFEKALMLCTLYKILSHKKSASIYFFNPDELLQRTFFQHVDIPLQRNPVTLTQI